MSWKRITKSPADCVVAPNLRDCDQACAEFSWDAARRELDDHVILIADDRRPTHAPDTHDYAALMSRASDAFYRALLNKAVTLALQQVPEPNSVWCGGEVVHVGVAISLRGGGRVAPVLHDAMHMVVQPCGS